MPTETEIVDQLRNYGTWLADRPGIDLTTGPRAAARTVVEAPLEDEDLVVGLALGRHRPRWSLLLVAAAAVLAVVCVGLVVASRSAAPADQPPATDPPGALYVLPRDDREVINPWRDRGPLAPHTGIVVGTPVDDGYRDPVVVMASDAAPDATNVAEQSSVIAVVTQPRAGRWLHAVVAPSDRQRAADVIDDVLVRADGTLFLEPGSADATVTAFTNDLTGIGQITYFELVSGVVVETAPGADPLDLPIVADTILAVTVDGRPAWHLTDDRSEEGTWHALAWMGSPHRMVAVSGTVAYADVVDAAQSLEVVSESEWETRLDIPPDRPAVTATAGSEIACAPVRFEFTDVPSSIDLTAPVGTLSYADERLPVAISVAIQRGPQLKIAGELTTDGTVDVTIDGARATVHPRVEGSVGPGVAFLFPADAAASDPCNVFSIVSDDGDMPVADLAQLAAGLDLQL